MKRMPQQKPMMMTGPLGISMNRSGSGTAWLPDASPMLGYHVALGDWQFMLHGNVFIHYIHDKAEDRGGREFGSINWLMPMLMGPVAGGELEARVMLSLEPATIPGCGYPDLLATGEICDGHRIVDEQHPHDLFMELTARYTRAISDDFGFQLYGGPVGEPALGPVAFPHRFSAFPNPIAPITHHWFDATHITFGVVTGGVFGRWWKLEGSVFNGREPDEDRYDFDFGPLDSYSGRFWLMPGERWAIQVSAGRLEEAEVALEPTPHRLDVWRVTTSATYQQPLGGGSNGAVTFGWAINDASEESPTQAVLAETAWYLSRNVLFGRAELVQKQSHDLAIEMIDDTYFVTKLQLGYMREIGTLVGLVPAVGGSVSLGILPKGLEPSYGTQVPVGFAVFVNVRPDAMPMEHGGAAHEAMGH